MRRNVTAGLMLGGAAFGLMGCADASPSLLADVDIAVRGHAELLLGELPRPLFLGDSAPELCLRAPADVDTTRWQLRTWYEEAEKQAHTSDAGDRLGRTVCFEAPLPENRTDGEWTLCAELVDSFDGNRAALDCHPVVTRTQETSRDSLVDDFRELMRQRQELENPELLTRLEKLGGRADELGYPFLALRTRLVRVYLLRRAGGAGAEAEAAALLSSPPSWLSGPHAESWRAQHAYEEATLALETSRALEKAWEALRTAEEQYSRVADPRRITVAMKQAEVLWLAGSPGFAREGLARAVAECRAPACNESFALAARNTLAWLTLEDPDAGKADLQQTESLLQEALSELEPGDAPIERANAAVNLAYARMRLGKDPTAALDQSRAVLEGHVGERERRDWMILWVRLIEGLDALRKEETDTALESCGEVAELSNTVELSTWAFSCIARARLAQGETEAAHAAIERALVLHEYATDDPLHRRTPIGPSQRARDTFLASRIAVDGGRPAEAWSLLEQLDRRGPPAPTRCVIPGGSHSSAEWNGLLLELTALDGPASAALRENRERARFGLMSRAQQLLRERWACAEEPLASTEISGSAEFRGFASEGQVILLQRADGEVRLHRRTTFDAESLAANLHRLDGAVQKGDTGKVAWTALARPLAAALVPSPEALGAQTVFSLHGLLQTAPMAALPMLSDESVLADHTLVVHRPAGGGSGIRLHPPENGLPLFVVDPAGNLPGGRNSADRYRSLFPRATVLYGSEATTSAIEDALQETTVLHVDAHASFDPLFPELTRLRLADAELPAAAWIDRVGQFELVNLSVCGAGRWPVTADSGRFGVAGLFARAGTPWVVAARADLSNPVAVRFNDRFYESLQGGASVPQAYRRAIDEVRGPFPPEKWASLVLISGNRESFGENNPVRTLSRAQAEEQQRGPS